MQLYVYSEVILKTHKKILHYEVKYDCNLCEIKATHQCSLTQVTQVVDKELKYDYN